MVKFRKHKIVLIDPAWVEYKNNDIRLKKLAVKGWIVIVAPVDQVRIMEV